MPPSIFTTESGGSVTGKWRKSFEWKVEPLQIIAAMRLDGLYLSCAAEQKIRPDVLKRLVKWRRNQENLSERFGKAGILWR